MVQYSKLFPQNIFHFATRYFHISSQNTVVTSLDTKTFLNRYIGSLCMGFQRLRFTPCKKKTNHWLFFITAATMFFCWIQIPVRNQVAYTENRSFRNTPYRGLPPHTSSTNTRFEVLHGGPAPAVDSYGFSQLTHLGQEKPEDDPTTGGYVAGHRSSGFDDHLACPVVAGELVGGAAFV